ncbi:MAG: NAD-dependent epimerase/dehydratase family protein [Sphingomonas bacterium]|uniref:family 1 glycosylhydrolase n=1 Tax=Sphingomonas bacterium TaxID=1895847 RepID=UPI002602D9C6|nr:family 1 glycosylhydrolase [Sphingomonas bacterium]MDB5696219.1 NAD-dependent epimerase/dehydratase family protein [Sphingomonas bacterium]
MKALELWGGPECTLNRVGDGYRDQFGDLGHYARDGDLALFAELGVTALRYPVLWERVAPDRPDECDWQWPDRQLHRLHAAGMRIIAGLIHHGSGPRYTDLLDPSFATGLALFAAKVAHRYDWVEDWTPVNEPLTTARFSALYGHWHPHHRSERSFWHALINQVDGTRLAMRAIRRVNPKARLIQTDDLGRTYATVAMREQAAFDNQRRWMGWDLLCGRVTSDHPFWKRLTAFGLEDRLRAIADDPCPPDVIGLNHYLTSDRFLDHRRQRYPATTHGGNHKVRFADVEALRVLEPPPPGLSGAVREAWSRYGIPIAITEVHNGSTRDEQMRWIAAAWDDCLALRAEGVEVQAVTSWSLLGSAGWNTLLREPGIYEVGAYDVSSGSARPTAVVPLLRGLAAQQPRHPVLAGAGWWQRPIRLLHEPAFRPAPMLEHARGRSVANGPVPPPLMICGATGTLGQALARACAHRDIAHVLTDRAALDLADEASVAAALDTHSPWAVINAAGWVRVDEAEEQEAACRQANTVGPIALARACAERNIATVNFSSDLVFDGSRSGYVETDEPCPLNAYGRSKAAMECGLLDLPGAHLIVRTAAFFSPHDRHNFAAALVRELGAGRPFRAARDEIVSPTFVPHLVDRVLDLLIDGETDIWHLANDDALSWADFAKCLAKACRLDEGLVVEVDGIHLTRAPRPRSAALRSIKGQGLGSLAEAIQHFAQHCASRFAIA